MNTPVKIFLFTAGGIALTAGAVHLAKTARTAGNLDIFLKSFSLFSQKKNVLGITIKIPKVIFKADLNINNPTSDELVISQPYLRVFYANNENPIGVSSTSAATHRIKPKESTPLSVDVEFPLTNVLPVMPDFLQYIISRIGGKKASRKVKIQMNVSGNGIQQTEITEVLI